MARFRVKTTYHITLLAADGTPIRVKPDPVFRTLAEAKRYARSMVGRRAIASAEISVCHIETVQVVNARVVAEVK